MAPPAAASRQVFGQTMHKKKGRGGGGSNYQRQFGGKSTGNPSTVYRSGGGDGDGTEDGAAEKAAKLAEFRAKKLETAKQVETSFGLERFALEDNNNQQRASRRGWLYNLVPTTVRVASHVSVCFLFVSYQLTFLFLAIVSLRFVFCIPSHFITLHFAL